jgi:hypothetical protein
LEFLLSALLLSALLLSASSNAVEELLSLFGFVLSVSLCHTDLRKPSVLNDDSAESPRGGDGSDGSDGLHSQKYTQYRFCLENEYLRRAPKVHNTLRCLVSHFIGKHLDNSTLVGAKILRHGDLEFNF